MNVKEYAERKPLMNPDRRMVLNMLEYILESKPELESVYHAILAAVPKNYPEWADRLENVTDAELVAWLKDYARKARPS